MIVILVGYSASGKDTIKEHLIERGLEPILSYTTRPMRDGEEEGKQYHFISNEEFKQMEEKGLFLESRTFETSVDGKAETWRYATPFVQIEEEKDYVMIKDLSGAIDILMKYGREDVVIFHLDVDSEERYKRAVSRGSFDKTEWKRRELADREKFTSVFQKNKDLLMEGSYYDFNISTLSKEDMPKFSDTLITSIHKIKEFYEKEDFSR